MGPPTPAYAGWKLDVLLGRWIHFLVDAFAGHAIHEFELDVGYGCGERDGIAAISAIG